MSIRFVVGRSGSGKTFRCLEAIRGRLREHGATGPKLLLIVPEQGSFQMERALIETPDLEGFTRCEVLSFQRLAYRIFAETGADPRRGDQTIGRLGRMMVIRRLIRHERSGLRLLDRVADKPGLVKQVAATLDELMRENVEPATLAELAASSEQDNPLAAAKIADLTRLYQAYLDYLIDDRVDPAQYLNLAADRVADCGWLDGAEVWLDGFAGFTQQEHTLLTRVAGKAARLEITLLVDPGASAIEADALPGLSYSLFARTERTMVRLRREFRTAGLEMDEAVRLDASRAPRFGASALDQLERQLFRVQGRRAAYAPATGTVRVLELPDPRAEVEAAVAEIDRLTRRAAGRNGEDGGDEPMRYRDIAIIVRDLTAYHDLISAAMRSHGIPCFLDRRQPTTHHPLIELVRSLLAVATDDCRLESVRLSLKTGLLPIESDDADLLENYLLAGGIAGRATWGEPWHYTRCFRHKGEDDTLTDGQQAELDRVNAIREQWLAAVDPWLDAVAEEPEAAGRTWAEALFRALDRMGVGSRLHGWADAAEGDGSSAEADTHRQVWADFVELLDEFVRGLGDDPMRIAEFRESIESGLAEFDLGLAPPTLDQVLVGAIERSRHPNIRVAFVLGFDDQHFPFRRAEDPLLGDRERDLLAAAGREIGASRRRQLLDERMLAYIALTRAGERLWISYPRTDTEGKPRSASPYLADVLATLPGLEVARIADPRVDRAMRWITRVGELGGRLAAEFRTRSVLEAEPDGDRRATWNALYDGARGREEWRHTLVRSLGGLAYENVAQLPPGAMRAVIPEPFTASVSRLERFAACPFAHFADYTLRLEPRVEAELADVDLGTICHAILETFMHRLAREEQSLADVGDDEIADRIDAIAAELSGRMGDDMMLGDARNAYLFDRSRDHLRRVVRWQRKGARVGRFRPRAVEYPFGYAQHQIPPLTLETPAGRALRLRGKIDRVDVAELGDALLGLVIDYKRTTARRLDAAKTYHGLALQLVGYLLALKQTGESLTGRPIRPVAAFYLPLLERYETVDHPSREKTTTYKWRGIAEIGALPALDETVEPGTTSAYFAASLKKDGTPHVRSDLAEAEAFTGLMRHVGRRMGELADRLLDGDIAVAPYRLNRQTPCSWCAYKPVCRYEIETQPPRRLESLTKSEVLARVAREVGDD